MIDIKKTNIKNLRKELGWKQFKMASYLYFSLTKYSNLENGIIPLTAEDLFKLAFIFNVKCEYIMGITQNKTKLTENERNEIKNYLNEIKFETDIYNR